MTNAGELERLVLCLDRRTGKVLWQRSASVGEAESNHRMNTFATPTCACDGQRVAAFFGRGGLHCFDMTGKKIWSRDLGKFPGPWGTAASPIILNDMVIQNCDAEGDSYIIAVNKHNGETLWQTSRGQNPRGGWSTPIVIDADSKREITLNGEHGVTGYDPATGKQLWFCQGFNGRGTPSPVFDGKLLYVVTAKPGDTFALRPGGSGDVTDSHMVWHTPRDGGRNLSSPALLGEYLLTFTMSGIGTCYESSTGKHVWTERLEGSFTASPVVAGELLYIQNEAGQTLVIRPGQELDIVARNDLGAVDGEIFRSSPGISDGQIFFRSDRALYCVEKVSSQD
jgi:outer membrane protein assembly factor BamB